MLDYTTIAYPYQRGDQFELLQLTNWSATFPLQQKDKHSIIIFTKDQHLCLLFFKSSDEGKMLTHNLPPIIQSRSEVKKESMGRCFTIYSVFLVIRKSIFDINEYKSRFFISRNQSHFLISKIHFLIYKNIFLD